MTTLERRAIRHEPVARDLTVVAAATVAPGIRRITLGGPALAGFASEGPADHIRVVLPAIDPAQPAPHRDLTPRAFRAGDAGGELDIDVFVHEGEGVCSGWAATVAPGSPARIAGPRGSRLVPDGMTALVLVGDESALPALARWIELTPVDVVVTALVASSDEAHLDYLPSIGHDLTARWFDGPDSPELDAALDEALSAAGDSTFAFLAGEAGMLVRLRRIVRTRLADPAKQATVSGYWRRGQAGFDHHTPLPED